MIVRIRIKAALVFEAAKRGQRAAVQRASEMHDGNVQRWHMRLHREAVWGWTWRRWVGLGRGKPIPRLEEIQAANTPQVLAVMDDSMFQLYGDIGRMASDADRLGDGFMELDREAWRLLASERSQSGELDTRSLRPVPDTNGGQP